MDEKVLKKIIKSFVRESLTEIFAEMQLEKIVESAVKRNISTVTAPKHSVNEVKMPVSKPSKPIVNDIEKKRKLKEALGVSDDMWNGIYGDISDNNPIIEHRDGVGPGQQVSGNEVPESVLEDMGLMRDYSKHLGDSSISSDNDDEWETRRKQREKIMNERFKRV